MLARGPPDPVPADDVPTPPAEAIELAPVFLKILPADRK
jgi:hypothetical protein